MPQYLGNDDWDDRYRPSARQPNRQSFYLNTGDVYDPPLQRTRSQGGPRPVINVYNETINDNHHTDNLVPGAFPAAPPPPPPAAAYYPAYQPVAQPVYQPLFNQAEFERGRLTEQLNELRLVERGRSRVRSRGHSDADSDYYRHEAERLERDRLWRLEQEHIRDQENLKHIKSDLRRQQHERDESAERRRIIAEYDAKKRKEAQDEKEAEERYRAKIEREEKEQKEKDEAAWQKFLLKQKLEKEKKEKEEKEEKEKIENEMRKRLADKGFAGNQIEAIISDEKKKTTTTTTSLTVYGGGAPTYAKVHKDYLSVRTLEFYDIPYKWDETEPDYIIILREMDKRDTDTLFEHTKALRESRLLIEAPKKEKDYAFYRKRDRSKSRGRGDKGEWKSFGILEYKR